MMIVADAGPILSFARAQRFALLQAVIDELIIPDAVYEEIVRQGAGKPGADEVQQAAWIRRAQIQDQPFADQLPQKLHRGEREAITLARELGGVLLVDEQAVRQEAQRLGVPYFGSLRVLTEAKDRNLILAIKPVLDELMAAGMYLSDPLYREFLQTIGEG
jgi:uncharacterized protein